MMELRVYTLEDITKHPRRKKTYLASLYNHNVTTFMARNMAEHFMLANN